MAGTLRSTLLRKYSYEEIRDLCFTEGSTFTSAFDCEWGVWRDKAVADFNISPQFFDLIRTLSGPQRYLQIASYVKLTPLSGVRVYKDTGAIEGVYEALDGFREALYRKDPEMLLWFANRVKPKQDEELIRIFPGEQSKLARAEKLVARWEREKDISLRRDDGSVNYLLYIIRRGNVRELDQIIHRYFTLPEGFSIAKDIPKVPFWEIYDEQGHLRTIYNLPLQTLDSEMGGLFDNLVEAVLGSGDTRIADFFLSIFRNREMRKKDASFYRVVYTSAKNSLKVHRKPEEAYGIQLRFFDQSYNGDGHWYDYMVELLLFLKEQGRDINPNKIWSNLGNIPYITVLLPLVSRERAKEFLEDEIIYSPGVDYYVLYPLSTSLIEEYLQKDGI
ncbi:Hypothetical protein BQ3484_159 [Cedratvirus A11]|uniref:Uncharacterized protein n=1 Tax=Cedratvirus A11 TaxID=1903266 RepID=A0A1M7XU84_9VIRU|nr:Hypothetical protein BQ3484_159 [Cedratvirus A11]SHO33227.1 Hypothetical protein BQ3484_159 [Cedratvirus A11]